MADGAGAASVTQNMESTFWAAQGELARQVTELAKQVGAVVARVDDRVTHKELMQSVTEGRKEFASKIDHMEEKFDQATGKVETSLDRAADRIKDIIPSIVNECVSAALSLRDSQEQKAAAAIQRTDAEIDRRIDRAEASARAANIRGNGGIATGIIAVLYAIGQANGWWGGGQ